MEEQLSLKDALFLAASLIPKESISLPLGNTSMRARHIKELVKVAQEIQKEANKHIPTQS